MSQEMPPFQSLTSSFSTFYSVSDDMLGLSFQLASLEENAAIYLWVIYFLVLLAVFYELSKFAFDICITLLSLFLSTGCRGA